MGKEELFYQDIMSQQFSVGTYYNSTRYLLLYALIDNGKFESKYSISVLSDKLFDIYCYNKDIALHHPNIEIRKIPSFGKGSIRKDIIDALIEFYNSSKSKVFSFDDNYVYVDISDENGIIAKQVKKILDVLFYKNFKTKFQDVPQPNIAELKMDWNMELFGKGVYKRKVFADMQFCVLCDNCLDEELVVVHILPAKLCDSDEMLFDVNNGIILCKSHAHAYLKREFYFDSRGKVISLTNNLEYSGMRLPIQFLKSRRYYIQQYEKTFH